MSTCDPLVQSASDGVAAALSAVDCMAGEATASAFARLFGPQGALLPALTILLTLYIAVFALALLTGRTRLSVSALTRRMMMLGVVLTFATSWIAYQGVLWNLVVGAPDQIASLLVGTKGQATQLFAGRIDLLFQAIADAADMAQQQQAAAAASMPAGTAPLAAPAATAAFAPSGLVWMAAVLLLLGTVGLLVTARIVLAVLLALGPVFIVLALFRGSRGLCAGWLRALVMVAVTPQLAVLGGALTIELAVPVVQRLAGPEGIEARPAFALFLVAAVHCALMALALRTAGTMVAGWRVFGLAPDFGERTERSTEGPAPAPLPAASTTMRRGAATGRTSETTAALITTTAHPAPHAAPHVAPLRSTFTPSPLTAPPLPALRAQGIGSRWRRPASPSEILR
ncbi:type IV secretion system protein [Novosphingobium flavum]|uniref:Type IV secretion system protein n=1 Tax=Novosphingobium flavum TaxID=1778672 RepID=A0A7X1KK26_9SPHN|nr:type IV secretion system protein [Novosphingobium flavum]MBC2664094.1 type IV secretion system protein [Novosphingobium flavum]